jgi:MFS family permease
MLAEVLGHGPILLGSAVLATTGTGICGGSVSLSVLVAGRFIQGIGGGGVMGVSLLVIADLIPKSHLVQFSNYVFRAQVIGLIIGSVAGGVYHDYTTWIWAFYSSFVFCAMGLLVVPFALDLRGDGRDSKGTPTSKFRTMDWIGAFLTLFGMGSLLTGISWGGTHFAWNGWETLVPISVGGVLILILVLYETKWAMQPMFSSMVFQDLSSAMLQAGGFLHGFIVSPPWVATSMWRLIADDISRFHPISIACHYISSSSSALITP